MMRRLSEWFSVRSRGLMGGKSLAGQMSDAGWSAVGC